MGVEMIMVLGGGRDEMVNSCFEDLEGKVGLNKVCEFVPEAGKKWKERVKVNSLFWQFHQNGVAGGP